MKPFRLATLIKKVVIHQPCEIWPFLFLTSDLFDHNIGVTMVRHPFVRLFSAYQDKVYADQTYAKQAFPRTSDFFRNGRDGAYTPPSFATFVDLLLRGKYQLDDIHFRPYGLNCAMCDIE